MSSTTTPFKSIAVFGSSGGLGPSIVSALLDSKAFTSIRAITRAESIKEKPQAFKDLEASGVQVYGVNLEDEDAVTEALQGVDAIVSSVNQGVVHLQSIWVRAAVRAGVKRFIPSEYGLDTQKQTESIFGAKRRVQEDIQKSGLEWTYLFTGVFADELIIPPFGFDIKNKTLKVVGNTSASFTVTYKKDIAAYIVEILKNPEVSRNRAIHVQSASTSFDQIADGFKAHGIPLNVSVISVEEARAVIKANPKEISSFFLLLLIKISEGQQIKFDRIDNALFPNVKPSSIEPAILVAIEQAKA